MGLEINRPLSVGGINPNINLYQSRFVPNFGTNVDSFEYTTLEKFLTQSYLTKAIASNPKIEKIVRDFNPEMNLNLDDLKDLMQNHTTQTREIANGIADNLQFSLKNKVDLKSINDAAYLHDIGKVLIPKEILNKPAKLDDFETKIMHTHSELSYEILKNSGLDEKTLKLIRNHHQNAQRSGYPWVANDFNADLNLQILSVADKYSALTERRPYKEPMSVKQALTIIYQDVKDQKTHPFVFKALVNYAKEAETTKILT